MALCDEISAGQDPCVDLPGSAGLETLMYLFNENDFAITYSASNALIITGFTAIAGAKMFKVKGFGDSFDASSTKQEKTVGPRFAELVMAQTTNNTSATKEFIYNLSAGRVKAITVSNSKNGDEGFNLFGAVNSLKATDNTKWQASNEDMQGGWALELGPPKGTLEPYPPRAVFIPPVGSGTPPATYASTLAALEAFTV